ncbi:hypothetical protein DFH94DRAFT_760225 [Russula ochroleuca]|uniref:DUF7330 domain-containing protein n=1 Tax=Russula ochroleuca TaxID=152965 RepID=A0A9P5K303_9AGAM|nr:hypothetical protein DFH94DRAFT_760225 [Russula ochroleuca]
MVTLRDEPNTWSELQLQESNIDEETETCIGDEGDRRSIVPTNYVCISKWAPLQAIPLKGQFILDLSLPPPPPHDKSAKSKRASLDLCSGNGMVRAIVHDPFSPDKSSRAFLDMELRANYKDIYISLPRCFRGPITIRTGDDRIAFSSAFEERMALISDVPGVRVYFVGNRPRGGKWGSGDSSGSGETVEDLLDEVTVDGRYTSVRINYDDDEEVPVMMPSGWQVFCGGAERFFTSGRVR